MQEQVRIYCRVIWC